MILRITDGTTTISLIGGTDGIYGGEEYVPRPPEVSEVEFEAEALYDGGELIEATRRNVAESLPLALVGSTPSAIQTVQHALETLLEQALHRQRRAVGDRVYLEYRPGDSGDIYRSEVLRGVVEPSQATASEKWLDVGAIGVVIAWKRRFYWEGPEVELPLTNAHGTGTGGVTVYNCHDSTPRDNFVDIDGGDVEGVIPAPIRLEMENTYDSGRLGHVFIGHNVFSNPANFDHILEAEDAATSGSVEVSATASGGEYVTYTLLDNIQAEVLEWTLPAALMAAAAGGHFQAIMRFHITMNTSTWFQFRIKYNYLTVWESQEFQVDANYAMIVRNLGVIQLPPWLVDSPGAIDDMSLELYARRAAGGLLYMDFLQLTPTDSYRVLFEIAYGVEYQERLVDDGILGLLYVDDGDGTPQRGVFVGRGSPIMIWPGRDQRLYFLTHSTTMNYASIDRTLSVRVFYRPRRLTL